MELFFTSRIEPHTAFPLPDEESRHLLKVLRYGAGDQIMLTDGSGKFYTAEIESISAKHCMVKILHEPAVSPPRGYHLHLAVAPPKNNERFEWFLEKATEIGIDEITPVLCRHSERKELKTDRMNKILISALKQSRNGRLPLLHPMTGIRGLMEKKEKAILYICTLQAEQFLGDIYKPGTDALVLIGPEGDFHPSEVEQAIGAGYIPVSLGKSRLRTETAALMACAIIASVNLSSVSKPQI